MAWRPHPDATGSGADRRPWLVLVPEAEDPWVRAVLRALTARREVTPLPLAPGDARRELLADRIGRALTPEPGAEETPYAGVLSSSPPLPAPTPTTPRSRPASP
ncbi:hypothetical protein ACFQVA_40915 [Actinomadura keratinilytica]